ncbi:MAG: acylphosphatase [Alphaproteobacteria bacterium]|jgi:acylphosphatase|nr:acylphosphatase [Alphaproteobacteria bacterium]MBT4710807.1 acylphosphatase [Alphaproteobacteria bacterium]MBT5861105.1 acylphosphatase [Alphaproteobacteria bacterium]
MGDGTRTVRVVVRGRVQMVWFRAWTQQRAGELGLSGWVRNCDDGSVEAVFRGSSERVDQMIEACHDGPPMAEVEAVDVTDHTDRVGDGFAVR